MQAHLDRELRRLRQHLGWTQRDVRRFNAGRAGDAREAVRARRERLVASQHLVGALTFPLRARPDVPRTYALPEVRRRAVPAPPPANAAPFVPEPALADDMYEYILSVFANMVRVMEQSPEAFATMDEETLRTHLLVQLNGHFEGRASGETFHGSGSTDILLVERDRSMFIGECKFWEGPGSLTGALDQLLDYATWRDAKAAVVVISRNAVFSAVVAQVPDVVRAHPQTRGDVRVMGETVFRSRLAQRDDAARELTVTTLVYNVPARRAVSRRLAAKAGRRHTRG